MKIFPFFVVFGPICIFMGHPSSTSAQSGSSFFGWSFGGNTQQQGEKVPTASTHIYSTLDQQAQPSSRQFAATEEQNQQQQTFVGTPSPLLSALPSNMTLTNINSIGC